MVQFVPLTRDRHGAKACDQTANYAFAADRTVVPLVAAEFLNAARTMPIALIEHAGDFVPVALMSLTRGKNSFVDPNGRWLGRYVPAAFRNYPFSLLRHEQTNEWVLCVDETSSAIVERGENSLPLFDDDGELSAAMKQMLGVLSAVEQNRGATAVAVAALKQAGVVRPWEVRRTIAAEQRVLQGLYCVDQAALEALGDDGVLAIRSAGALTPAYTQMLSMGQLEVLDALARMEMEAVKAKPGLAQPQDKQAFGLTAEDALIFGE
jgi:hypothetical protein